MRDLLSATGADTIDFSPPRWLRSPHIQSILASAPLRRPAIRRRVSSMLAASRPEILDCGDGVRLLGQFSSRSPGMGSARDVAILLHGWEGSADSLYILSLAGALHDRGWDVLRLNLRDHGNTHGLNPELFHSCRIAEVVGAVARMQQLRPDARIALAGFSLGGNFALRVGARAAAAGLRLRRIVSVCPVLDPRISMNVLENGHALYREYFIYKWKRSLRLKQAAWPHHYRFDDLLASRSLLQMTDVLVRRYADFPDLETYLGGYAITGQALGTLDTPSRIIMAFDDPIILAGDLKHMDRIPALSTSLTRYGGHCGYVESPLGCNWIDRTLVAELEKD